MKPTKIPDSFVNQRNNALDPTSFWEPPKGIHCFSCNEWMPGDQGVMRAVKLAGSEVRLHVIIHPGCQDHVS